MTSDDITSSATLTEDLLIPGPHGDIPVRIYHPAHQRTSNPRGLVWCHGGAYAYGTLDEPESDWVARSLAEVGIAVVAVDYRLTPVPAWALEIGAPEGRGTSFYPVARTEAETVLAWADTELRALSPVGWALGGASAGGTIAASATKRLLDSGRALPPRLVLVYPLLHPELPPYTPELAAKLDAQTEQTGIPLTRETVRLITLNYVDGDQDALDDPYAFPAGHDVTGFPPTLVIHSDTDTLRASSAAFAGELAAAGVDVVSLLERGTVHGHLSTPETIGAQRSIRRMASWLGSEWITPAPDVVEPMGWNPDLPE
ncbi:alpha/beta hydrolase [Rathayibacter sp. VKM Ac-2857]|uniref:alpha/beta hydrolase n=1 Tax=Rathayibacter sp. VKM Ac-2857 TaxID=2739020 RepID=UPI0015658952|nr:alpha/beta hydrolase [Rathayibacter sp. VKM Ac-2857]NQX17340.1 alpha/beta hydrolase [Rathayibacter sp. VKM Ac-2857]